MNRLRLQLEQEPTKINLKIKFKNFGPISKGTLNLKPLTILIGPNNSGKSYAAMVVHSALSSENNLYQAPFILQKRYLETLDVNNKDIDKVVKLAMKKKEFTVPLPTMQKIHNQVAENIFAKIFEEKLCSNFGSTLRDLVKTGQKTAQINIAGSNILNIKINTTMNIKSHTSDDITRKFKVFENRSDYLDQVTNFEFYALFKRTEESPSVLRLRENIWRNILKNFTDPSIPQNSFYFPAARSGILQAHKILSANLVKSAQFAGTEQINIPKLNGVVSDFIYNLILISEGHGHFTSMGEQLESDLLNGHIKLPSPSNNSMREIVYAQKHDTIPLHRASSTISEIAPFSLYLKHIVSPSSMLIIEEPEAHLHPENQLILARYIVKMIRAGLNVLITTHSVFLLEQLGKFLLAEKLDSRSRKKLGYNGDYLLANEVSPHLFSSDDNDGHKISEIRMNDEDGIPQDEFVKVSESLYSDHITLHEQLSKER